MKRTAIVSALLLCSALSAFGTESAIWPFNREKPKRERSRKARKTVQTVDSTALVPVATVIVPDSSQTDDVEVEPAVEPQDPRIFDSLLVCWRESTSNDYYQQFFKDYVDDTHTAATGEALPDSIYEARLRAILSPIHMPYNSVVKQYILRYTSPNSGVISKVLGLSKFYFPLFERELAAAGLPLELRMLPVIESALTPSARSRVGAMGLWQFMLATGRSYGMEVTSFVDQRCDPEASTRAACRYLADLYRIYGDWTLVIAAYNCGPGNVNKAFKRAGESAKTYWDIYPYLPAETRGYVPSFIAATYAFTYHDKHNISPREAPIPLVTDTVMISKLTHFEQISSTIGIPMDALRELNPQFKQDIIPAVEGKSYVLTLPMYDVGKFIDNEAEIMGKDTIYLKEYLNPSNLSAKQSLTASASFRTHKVQKGETLSTIARKYGVTVKEIVKWNKLKNPNKLSLGQRLEIHR